jgi:DNA repair photolyase
MALKIAEELKRKRKKPDAVYFCPSCDPFQPIPEIQQIIFEVMKLILENNIGVQFVTKENISEEIIDLFKKYNSKIAGQIGLISVDDKILKVFEPNAATAKQRINQLERLIKIGISMSIRCDPMISGVTDTNEQLQNLFSVIAGTGCKEAAVSFLFLRPAITASFKTNVKDVIFLNKILKPFSQNVHLTIGNNNSRGTVLTIETRKLAFEKIIKIANDFGIKIHVCGCKNRDITDESCNITRRLNFQKSLFYTNR